MDLPGVEAEARLSTSTADEAFCGVEPRSTWKQGSQEVTVPQLLQEHFPRKHLNAFR
jgi:hypothetical protein